MKDPFKGMTFSEPISFKEFVKSYDNYLDHCSGVSRNIDNTIQKSVLKDYFKNWLIEKS